MNATALAAALAAALLATPKPPGPPAPDPVAAAQAWVTRICKVHGADPTNPWALAHGVGAFGPELRASDGRLAIDVMAAAASRERGPGKAWTFPDYLAGAPVDPHADHTVATLLHAGVPLMRTFQTPHGPVSLGELVDAVKRRFRFTRSDDFFKEHPWTLMVLAEVTDEGAATFSGAGGDRVDLAKILDETVGYLREQSRFLEDARREGVAMVPKRKQGVWGHPCGGLHLAEAAFAWMDQPRFRQRHLAEAHRQIEILFYRAEVEPRAYDEALAQAPQYALQINVQRLKFFGHWLEAVLELQRAGAWTPTPAKRAAVQAATRKLTEAVAWLERDRVAERMGELKVSKLQTYLDLVGDGCHAVTGLKLASELP